MVFEFMNQGNLVDLVRAKQKQLYPAELLLISTHILNGMCYLEENNIIHRDLALRNVLITQNSDGHYVAKISDFGLSRFGNQGIYSLSSTSANLPIKWTAPESALYGQYNNKTDVWSFGIALWELYSYGMTPYPSMTNDEALNNVVKGYRMPAPENCPENIYKIMLKCWAAEPSERPSFTELSQMFSEITSSLINYEKSTSFNQEYDGNAYQLTSNLLFSYAQIYNAPGIYFELMHLLNTCRHDINQSSISSQYIDISRNVNDLLVAGHFSVTKHMLLTLEKNAIVIQVTLIKTATA
jgi:serine/threonine protein kinase